MKSVANRMMVAAGGEAPFVVDPTLGTSYTVQRIVSCYEYVAVSTDGNTIVALGNAEASTGVRHPYVSSDSGLTFTRISVANTPRALGLATDGTRFVIALWNVSNHVDMYYADSPTSATTWTFTSSLDTALPSGPTNFATYLNGVFILAYSRGVYYTSPDGVTWTRRDLYATLFRSQTHHISSAAFHGGRYVFTLSRQDMDTDNAYMVTVNTSFGDRKLVNGDGKGYATNGSNIHLSLHSIEGFGLGEVKVATTLAGLATGTSVPLTFAPTGIAFGAGLFVIVDGTNALSSADGVTWTVRTSSLPGGPINGPQLQQRIRFMNGGFVTWNALDQSYAHSADGITWTNVSTPGLYPSSIAFGNDGSADVYMMVTSTGSVRSSPSITAPTWTTLAATGVTDGDLAYLPTVFRWVLASTGLLQVSGAAATAWSTVTMPGGHAPNSSPTLAVGGPTNNLVFCSDISNRTVLASSTAGATAADWDPTPAVTGPNLGDVTVFSTASHYGEILTGTATGVVLSSGSSIKFFWDYTPWVSGVTPPTFNNYTGMTATISMRYDAASRNSMGIIVLNGNAIAPSYGGFHYSTDGFATSAFVQVGTFDRSRIDGMAYGGSGGTDYVLSSVANILIVNPSGEFYSNTTPGDLTAWTLRDLADGYNAVPGQLISAEGRFGMVDIFGRVWSSTNGTSWSIVSTLDDTFGCWLSYIGYVGSKWLVLGGCHLAITRASLGSGGWTVRHSDPPMNDTHATWFGAAGAGRTGLTGGGVTPWNVGDLLHAGSFVFNSISYNSALGLWIAVGDGGRIYTAAITLGTEGAVPYPSGAWTLQTSGVAYDLKSVACQKGDTDPHIVVVGSNSSILTSVDGVTWASNATSGSTTQFTAVCPTDNPLVFFAAGNYGSEILKTVNGGTSWANYGQSPYAFSEAIDKLLYDDTTQTLFVVNHVSFNGWPYVGDPVMYSTAGAAFAATALPEGISMVTMGTDRIYSLQDGSISRCDLSDPATLVGTASAPFLFRAESFNYALEPHWAVFQDYTGPNLPPGTTRQQRIGSDYVLQRRTLPYRRLEISFP